MNTITEIVKRINQKPKKRYNILTFSTHEGYQTLLDRTEHNFFLLELPNKKQWETKYRPVPPNHYQINTITSDLEIDFILSQEKFGALQYCLELQLSTRWPIIHLEHVEPQDKWSEQQFQKLKTLRGDINVFITKHNQKSWGFDEAKIIPHGIDTDLFKGWRGNTINDPSPYILYVVNHLVDRDYFCGYKQWQYIKDKVQERCPSIQFKLVGENGLLGKASSSIENLVSQYQNCLCYLNTSQLSPIPMSLLEAASCGCPIITTSKQEIPNVFSQTNSHCSNDLDLLVENILSIIEDSNNAWANKIGTNARDTILQKYSLDKFIKNWNNVFDQAYEMQLGKVCTLC